MIILEGFENTVFSLADIGINHYKIRNITSELDNPIPYFPLVNTDKLLDLDIIEERITTELIEIIDSNCEYTPPVRYKDILIYTNTELADILANIDTDDVKKICYEIDLEYNPVLKKAYLALWIDFSKSEKLMKLIKQNLEIEERAYWGCMVDVDVSLDADDKEYLIKALSDYVIDCCIYGIREEDIIESKKVS